MADRWCTETSGKQYGEFLLTLLGFVADRVGGRSGSGDGGTHVWKADDAIEYGGYSEALIVEKTPLERDVLARRRSRELAASVAPKTDSLLDRMAVAQKAQAERDAAARQRAEALAGAKAEAEARRAAERAAAKLEADARAKAEAEARRLAAEQAEAEAAALDQARREQMDALRRRMAQKTPLRVDEEWERRRETLGEKAGATSMKVGQSDILRKSKRDELLVHGEYLGEPQSFERQAGGWHPTRHNTDALWHEISYGDTDVAGGVDHKYRGAADRTGATSMHGGYSNALRQSKNGDVLDHGEYQSNRFQDVCLDRSRKDLGGWRPTQQNTDALWNEISYGDTDVAGGVDHKYRGAADRTGATSMHGGYSNALRQSKNGDVLDHGEYQSNRFQDVCLDRSRKDLGGWRPTQQNTDALWNEISYGDTDVAGAVPDVRNLPPLAAAPTGAAAPFTPGVYKVSQPDIPMTTYEDDRFEEVRNLGKVPTIINLSSCAPTPRASTSGAMLAPLSRSPRRAAMPPAPLTARSGGMLRTGPIVSVGVLGAELQWWKPIIAPTTARSPRGWSQASSPRSCTAPPVCAEPPGRSSRARTAKSQELGSLSSRALA